MCAVILVVTRLFLLHCYSLIILKCMQKIADLLVHIPIVTKRSFGAVIYSPICELILVSDPFDAWLMGVTNLLPNVVLSPSTPKCTPMTGFLLVILTIVPRVS